MRRNKLLISLMIAGLVMSKAPIKVAEGKDNQWRTEQTETEATEIEQVDTKETVENQPTTEPAQYTNIGSVSKVYVTTAVMQLVEQGKVDIDAPVTKYISEFKLADERYKDITVRMLMNHTSGLKGSVYADAFRFDDKSMEYHDSFLEILSKERLKYTPGEYNCYCNDGFTLLEILVERVSGMSFTEYLEKNITAPLDLDNTNTMWSVENFDNQVPCYMDGDIRMAPECVQLLGSGGIMSDAEELCTFGTTFFKGNEVLLSEKSKEQMAENQVAGLSKSCFGLGWDSVSSTDYEAAGVKVLQKNGGTCYQHALLAVAPEEEISVAVVASGGMTDGDDQLAREIMDIALEEKGIKVEHPEREMSKIVDKIPKEVTDYAGRYIHGRGIFDISFPEDRYMLVRALSDSDPYEVQCVYTENGKFVKVSGDVESGNAIPDNPIEESWFETAQGRAFMLDESGDYQFEKITENKVNDSVHSAWNDRNGVTYFCTSLNYNDPQIIKGSASVTLNTYDELEGYVNNLVMIDEKHAENRLNIPGTISRDTSDMVITNKDGCEMLTYTDTNMSYISEKNISDYSSDITEVKTTSGNAVWYRLNGVENETVRLDIPENAAVYVFDKFGKVKYSSYMKDYGNCVPLPEYGMIVFMGDTGAKIGISR